MLVADPAESSRGSADGSTMEMNNLPQSHVPRGEPDTPAVVAGENEVHYAQQRQHPRIKCFIAVQMKPESDYGLVLGNLSDVSLGGCGIESANHIPMGTPVAVCPLTAAGELWVRGHVVNTRFSEGSGSFHLGVRFVMETELSSEHNIQKFMSFVEQAAARQNTGDRYLRKLWGL